MMTILVTEEFEKRYLELPDALKGKAKKQERMFRENPHHPSLNTEKIEPKGKELWTIRVDKKYRILFRFIDNQTVKFLSVGPHDWIYRYTR